MSKYELDKKEVVRRSQIHPADQPDEMLESSRLHFMHGRSNLADGRQLEVILSEQQRREQARARRRERWILVITGATLIVSLASLIVAIAK